MGCPRREEESRAERRRAVRGPPFFLSSFSFSFSFSAASCAQAVNGRQMWKKKKKNPIFIHIRLLLVGAIRHYSRVSPPPPAYANPIIRVSNNIARLGPPQEGPKPRQVLSLPPFPGQPLPGKDPSLSHHPSYVTAISWVKYYFHEIPVIAIRSHFHKGLVHVECSGSGDSRENQGQKRPLKKIMPSDVMEVGARIHVPVSIAETRISKRFDTIPSGTLYPNADEIEYLQRLVKYKDSAILVLNKPPRMPVKGNLPVHNSMDALAAAALSYEYDEGPKLVHRLDRESSGLHLMGRTKASINLLNWLFSDLNNARSQSKAWNDACEATCQRYWALVIGSPKEKEGLIEAPLSKVLLDDGKTERIILAQNLDLEACQEAITEYRVLGPTINGCTWMELRPITRRKHQLRVHCAEALGTPIVGDYKYGWFVHRRWKQMARGDVEPMSGEPYKMRRPAGLDVQKGSVLAKVPLLHLHCRELVVANIEKFVDIFEQNTERSRPHPAVMEKPDLLRFVASMPSHMKISWNLMSSYLV